MDYSVCLNLPSLIREICYDINKLTYLLTYCSTVAIYGLLELLAHLVYTLAARGRGQSVVARPGLHPPADEMDQNEEGTHNFLNVPQSKFWSPSCAPTAEKFWRRHCVCAPALHTS